MLRVLRTGFIIACLTTSRGRESDVDDLSGALPSSFSFALSGLVRGVFTPTAYAVGCILSPLRGWSMAACCSVFRRTFSALEATTGERLWAGYYFVGSVGQDEVDSAGLVGLQGFGEIEGG